MLVESIKSAKFCQKPDFIRTIHHRGRRRQGVKYEAIVQDFLTRTFNTSHNPSPWIEYKLGNGWQTYYCQPDALINIEPGKILIVEVKYQHTPEAYFQLFDKYEPLVRKMFPACTTTCIEICKWFDPNIVCPKEVTLCQDLLHAKPGKLNVHIFNP